MIVGELKDDFCRVCPKCRKMWDEFGQWHWDTHEVDVERRGDQDLIVREHTGCGGQMYMPGQIRVDREAG